MSSLTTGFRLDTANPKTSAALGGVLNILSGPRIPSSPVASAGSLHSPGQPGTLPQGEIDVDVAGNRLNICSATNTWTVVGTQT